MISGGVEGVDRLAGGARRGVEPDDLRPGQGAHAVGLVGHQVHFLGEWHSKEFVQGVDTTGGDTVLLELAAIEIDVVVGVGHRLFEPINLEGGHLVAGQSFDCMLGHVVPPVPYYIASTRSILQIRMPKGWWRPWLGPRPLDQIGDGPAPVADGGHGRLDTRDVRGPARARGPRRPG